MNFKATVIFLALSIPAFSSDGARINLKGDKLRFLDSSGNPIKTIVVGLAERNGYLSWKEGEGGPYRRTAISEDKQAVIVVDSPGEMESSVATIYDVRGHAMCSIKGGKDKEFTFPAAFSASRRLFALSKRPICMPHEECKVLKNIKLEHDEPQDGLLIYSFDCKLIFQTGLISNMQRFSPTGRYLIFNKKLVDMNDKTILDPPIDYNFTGLAKDGIVEFCHFVRLKGCTTFKE
jgi:hypothetical protein